MMEIVLAILAKLIAMFFPVILRNAQDRAEEGSDKDVGRWRETVKAGGWTDEAIAATEPE